MEPLEDCNSEPPSIRSEQGWNANSNLYAKKPELFNDKQLWSVSRLCTAFEVWKRKDLSKSEKLKKVNGAKISRNMERKLGNSISQQLSSFVNDEDAKKYSVTWEQLERLYNFCGPYLSLPQANIAGFLDLVAGQFNAIDKEGNDLVDTASVEPSPGNRVEASRYGSYKGEIEADTAHLKSSDVAVINSEVKLSPQHKRARTRSLLENFDNDSHSCLQGVLETRNSRKENHFIEPSKLHSANVSGNCQVSGVSSSSAHSLRHGKQETFKKDLSAAWDSVSSTVHSYRLKGQQAIESRTAAFECDGTRTLDTGRTAGNVLEQVLSMDTGIVKWCLMEFFDAYVDSSYLNFSEFSDVLEKEMGIHSNMLLSTKEWRFIRKAMCDIFSSGTKPRRLSKKFLLEERQRLWRKLVRQYLMNSEQVEFYPWAPCPSTTLAVGSKVIARNWTRGEVYSAYVVTLNPLKEQLTVKFDEAQLASSSIKDVDVMVPEPAARLSNESEAFASSTWSTKDSQPSTEYFLKKLQSLQSAEEELNAFDSSNLQGNDFILEVLKRKSQISALNLECDELFLQTFQYIRDCQDLKYLSQVSKVLLKGIVGDDETCFPGNLEQVLVALLNVLISAFQVVNFSTVENSDTSRSLLLSTVQNLQKLLTDENKQSFAILMESARQLNSTL